MGHLLNTYALVFALLIGNSPGVSIAQTRDDKPQARPNLSVQTPAKEFFGAARLGSLQKPESFGSYAKGCLAGGLALPETGPTWQAMRLSRNRNWGQPITVGYLQDLSHNVAKHTSWSGIYIGDISQPRGGPMLSGHASHQIGLDADIWLLPKTDQDLSIAERERPPQFPCVAHMGHLPTSVGPKIMKKF